MISGALLLCSPTQSLNHNPKPTDIRNSVPRSQVSGVVISGAILLCSPTAALAALVGSALGACTALAMQVTSPSHQPQTRSGLVTCGVVGGYHHTFRGSRGRMATRECKRGLFTCGVVSICTRIVYSNLVSGLISPRMPLKSIEYTTERLHLCFKCATLAFSCGIETKKIGLSHDPASASSKIPYLWC